MWNLDKSDCPANVYKNKADLYEYYYELPYQAKHFNSILTVALWNWHYPYLHVPDWETKVLESGNLSRAPRLVRGSARSKWKPEPEPVSLPPCHFSPELGAPMVPHAAGLWLQTSTWLPVTEFIPRTTPPSPQVTGEVRPMYGLLVLLIKSPSLLGNITANVWIDDPLT